MLNKDKLSEVNSMALPPSKIKHESSLRIIFDTIKTSSLSSAEVHLKMGDENAGLQIAGVSNAVRPMELA